jgi:perosamine synthetase
MKKISISNIPDLSRSIPALNKLIKTRWISSSGKYVSKFEKIFSNKIGNKYSVTMSNGTTALISAISCLKKKNTKYIALPSLTFGACANAIKSNNIKPVFIDSEFNHWNISLDDLKKKFNLYKFKILIVVHLNGYSANIIEIKNFCKKNNIKIIEDCAEALFTKFRNKFVGSYGDIATFSFFANKLITTGEGGMCSTNIKNHYTKIKISASHGMQPKKKYWHIQEGFNHRMTSLQSVVGITMLSQVKKFIKARKFNNFFYLEFFKKKNYFQYVRPYKGDSPVMWYFPFILNDKYKNKKAKLTKYLNNKNIETRSFFYPLDSMKIFSAKRTCHNANNFSKKGMYLPVDPTLKVKDLKYICNSINNFFNIK